MRSVLILLISLLLVACGKPTRLNQSGANGYVCPQIAMVALHVNLAGDLNDVRVEAKAQGQNPELLYKLQNDQFIGFSVGNLVVTVFRGQTAVATQTVTVEETSGFCPQPIVQTINFNL